MPSWTERLPGIADIAGRQLFFIGGAPRSGTTWLQQLLDAHPDVICQGEGLFLHHLAAPLEKLMVERGRALDGKNTTLFSHTGGYPLPAPEDTEFLIGTAILLAMSRQAAGRPGRAIGEKTPENVFFFPRLRRLFPTARFIAIARDPRDVLSSAWHFFRRTGDEQEKRDFVRSALPSLGEGARAMLAFADQHPESTALVTYEGLLAEPMPTAARLYRLLGVSDSADIVADCVARTAFAALAARPQSGSFYRKGVVGDWRSTLDDGMNRSILDELGWMFSRFEWQQD